MHCYRNNIVDDLFTRNEYNKEVIAQIATLKKHILVSDTVETM